MAPARRNGAATHSAPRSGTDISISNALGQGHGGGIGGNVAGRIRPASRVPLARQRARFLRPEADAGLLDQPGPTPSSHLVLSTVLSSRPRGAATLLQGCCFQVALCALAGL